MDRVSVGGDEEVLEVGGVPNNVSVPNVTLNAYMK